MSVISRLASSLGRRDEVPNQELAKELCETRDTNGIAELIENLFDTKKAVQHDCIKVLYEIGYVDPGLISRYVSEFLRLLSSKDNRMVWSGMIALSTIALEKADEIYANVDLLLKTMEEGSVITVDNGVSVLAKVSSTKEVYEKRIVPYLLNHLRDCRAKEVGQHAEKSLIAMNVRNREQFKDVLLKRLDALSSSQKARVKRVLKKIDRHQLD